MFSNHLKRIRQLGFNWNMGLKRKENPITALAAWCPSSWIFLHPFSEWAGSSLWEDPGSLVSTDGREETSSAVAGAPV